MLAERCRCTRRRRLELRLQHMHSSRILLSHVATRLASAVEMDAAQWGGRSDCQMRSNGTPATYPSTASAEAAACRLLQPGPPCPTQCQHQHPHPPVLHKDSVRHCRIYTTDVPMQHRAIGTSTTQLSTAGVPQLHIGRCFGWRPLLSAVQSPCWQNAVVVVPYGCCSLGHHVQHRVSTSINPPPHAG